MKRIAFIAGLALTIWSCAQHDSKSPDTSGVDAQNPNDTVLTTPNNTNSSGQTNANNDGSNNNQTINTADSSLNKNRQNQ